jgi:integrase
VPITRRLRIVLERRQSIAEGEPFKAEDYVFGNEVGEQRLWIYNAWATACEKAGINDLHFHDLRREFASRLLETPGVSLHDVSDWVGHSNVITTSRYLSTSGVRKQRVLERFEAGRHSNAP